MPKSISDFLGVDETQFAATGAFDAVLDVDSLLFIDPHLLRSSAASEIATSYTRIQERFRQILKLLLRSRSEGDPFWRQADRLFTFPELKGLCIGYSGKSTAGSGMGPTLRLQLLRTAKSIVDAGSEDPEIFELMGVFEENIGPDRISDMVGRIIVEDLFAYSARAVGDLRAKTVPISYKGQTYNLVRNPYNGSPVILIPMDILRDLPVAHSWSEIDLVCAHNDEVRRRVNSIIGDTWRKATREKKETLKRVLLSEPEVVRDLLELYKNKLALRYDFENDPAGEVAWYKATKHYTAKFPLPLCLAATDAAAVLAVVVQICEKFRDLVENNDLSSLLYENSGKPKHESAAQKLFYGIADAYCAANNVDLSREANAGRGPVDFKLSKGYVGRVVVEAKLTTNQNLVHGFTTQIGEYQKAEKTQEGVYLVIDVGGPPRRIKELNTLLAARKHAGDRMPLVIFIDAIPKPSASKYQRN